MYRQKPQFQIELKPECQNCGSRRFRAGGGKLICYECGHLISEKVNKYKNVRQTFQGYSYHSKAEANYAAELQLRIDIGEILHFERQVRIAFYIDGHKITTYIVDFKIHHKDGTFELVEVKGAETEVWIIKRKLLEFLWLPQHPDHIYTVVKAKDYGSKPN